MRLILAWFLLLGALLPVRLWSMPEDTPQPGGQPAATSTVGDVQIKKVLAHLLDRKGRHTIDPSLYERDAYQQRLRQNPLDQGGLRFDVHWVPAGHQIVVLRAELRGTHGDQATSATISSVILPKRRGSLWSALKLEGDPFRTFGKLTAWRITAWDGEQLLAEQRSFLW